MCIIKLTSNHHQICKDAYNICRSTCMGDPPCRRGNFVQNTPSLRSTMISARVLSDLRLSLGYTPREVSRATFPCLGHLNGGASRGFLILPISGGEAPLILSA